MTIRAVDIVTTMPRIQEAGRQQHQNQLQSLAGHQAEFAQQLTRAEKAQHQVAQAPASREVAVQKDGGRRKGSGRQGSGRQQQAAEEGGGRKSPQRLDGHRLDIKV